MNNSQFPPTLFKADWAENNNGLFYEMQQHVRQTIYSMPRLIRKEICSLQLTSKICSQYIASMYQSKI